MTQASHSTLDLRHIAPPERHPRIFSTFEQLVEGTALELINDHDPQPLHHQFQSRHHGKFTWDYLETGPQTWRVRIGKAPGNCCGGCGG